MFPLPPDTLLTGQEDDAGSREPLDPRAFRDALGGFATGITVITSVSHCGEPVGVTVNSFNSVSMEPPLVLFSLARNAFNWRTFLSSQYFAVNVLSAEQQNLSNRFALAAADTWEGVEYETWETGCPVLLGAAASFECEVRCTHDGGDHVIFVGEVRRMVFDSTRSPLIYHRGRYAGLAGD